MDWQTSFPLSVQQIYAKGVSRTQLRQAVQAGKLRRLRYGWYTAAGDNSEVAQAVALGGHLAGLSACKYYGLWVPDDQKLHVAMSGYKHRQLKGKQQAADLAAHRLRRPLETPVVPLLLALQQVLKTSPYETAFIVLESAVNQQKISAEQASALIEQAPRRIRDRRHFFDPSAQSGSETRLRLFFQSHRVKTRTQQRINRVGWVDLLVGNSWIVEADSQAFHGGELSVDNDRRRDMHSRHQEYQCERFSFQQIWVTWEETQAYLLERIRTRRHYKRPTPKPPLSPIAA